MKQKQYGVKLKRILNYFPPVYQYFRSQSTHQLSKWYPVSKALITIYSSKRSFWDSQNLCSHILTLNCHELLHGAAALLAEPHKKSEMHEQCYFPPFCGNLSPFLAAQSPFAFMGFAVVVSDLLALLNSFYWKLSFLPTFRTSASGIIQSSRIPSSRHLSLCFDERFLILDVLEQPLAGDI